MSKSKRIPEIVGLVALVFAAGCDTLKIANLNDPDRKLSMPQPERDRNLVKLYLQRAGHLGYWGYQELLRRASASSEEAVRAFVAEDLNSILPPAGLTAENRSQRLDQARLRAVLLLREMKASLRPDEQKMLEENAALVQGSPAYHPDWEDVLDRN